MPWYGSGGTAGSGSTAGVNVKGSRATAADLPTTGTLADSYITRDDGHLHVYDGSQFVDTGPIVGPKGATPTLQGGTVTPLAWGQPVTATLTQTSTNVYRLDLGLPAGRPGDDGQPRFSGHGLPGTITGSQPGDLYLDVDTFNMYQLS